MTDYMAEKLSEQQLEHMPLQLADLAWAFYQIGQKDKAYEWFDRALAAAGEDFMSYTNVARAMTDVIPKTEALARISGQAKADGANIERQKALVHMFYLNGRPQDALETAKSVGKLAVRDQDIVFAHLAQGMLLEQLNRAAEAQPHYEAVLKIDPKQPIALNNIAYLLGDTLKKPAESLPYAQQAVRADPNNANVLDTLGYMLLLNNRVGEAMGALLRAKDIDKENVAVHYHLGLAFQKKNDPEEAKLWLLKARELAQKKGDEENKPKINKALGEKS
jgi:tetratricopeptide (TPR) repeat protein